MMTKYEEQMYHDIHRIANALEKIAKSLENPLTNVEPQDVSSHINLNLKPVITCPHCVSTNVKALYGMSTIDGKTISTHYICKDCHKEFNV